MMQENKQFYDDVKYWEDFYRERLKLYKDYKSKRSIFATFATWIGLGWRASLPVAKIAAKKVAVEGSKSLLKKSYTSAKNLLTWKNAKAVANSILIMPLERLLRMR